MTSSTAHDRLLTRLGVTAPLTADEIQALRSLPFTVKDVRARQDIVHEGHQPSQCCLVVEGVLCRVKELRNGDRQIMSIHVAGDVPDLHSLYLDIMDHTLAALTAGRVALIPHDAIRSLVAAHPRLGGLLWRETLIDAAIFREWIVNIGCRDAYSRIAHLFCEVFLRLQIVGLTDGFVFDAPMTQGEIAEAMGLTPVHVNRVLQRLRSENLLAISKRQWTIANWDGLVAVAGFDATYLHSHPAR